LLHGWIYDNNIICPRFTRNFFKNYQLFDFSNDYHYHNIEFMNVNLFHDFNSKVNLEEKSDKLKIIKDKNSRFKHTYIVTNIPLKVE